MENKLVVNCDICDARKANEEILKKFEQICINADCLLVDERSKAVISQLPVKCNLSRVIQIESEEEVGTVSYNGKYEITGELPCTGKKLLCVNGLLVIHPGTEEILKSYIQIFVNGAVSYPESMSAWISQISVNGSMESYPDHYTLMEREWILDRYFPIRAKENGNYFSAKSIEITDKAVDTALLLKKNVHFQTKEFYVLEEKLEDCAKLFPENVKFQVIPAGFSFIRESMILKNDLLLQYGNQLYIKGDLIVEEKSRKDFSQIEELHLTGTLYLPEEQRKELDPKKVFCKKIETIKGNVIWKKKTAVIDTELLLKNPEGISLLGCAVVKIDPAVSEQELLEKVCLRHCALVKCSKKQMAAVGLIEHETASIQCDEEKDERKEATEEGSQVICTNWYVL